MSERYLYPVQEGRWAISREVNGRWIAFIQDTPPDEPDDCVIALRACGMQVTGRNLDRFFPVTVSGARCPTLMFLEIFSQIGAEIKTEHGV